MRTGGVAGPPLYTMGEPAARANRNLERVLCAKDPYSATEPSREPKVLWCYRDASFRSA